MVYFSAFVKNHSNKNLIISSLASIGGQSVTAPRMRRLDDNGFYAFTKEALMANISKIKSQIEYFEEQYLAILKKYKCQFFFVTLS